MNELHLVKPSIAYEKEYMSMFSDWKQNDPASIPWFINAGADFPAFVTKLNGFSHGIGLDEGYVENTTFWLMCGDNQILGAINIRHRLNEFLMNFGGQVGYGVRPGERRKGHATEMLRLGLAEARKMGLESVLVCCYSNNAGSVRTIEKNKGVLEGQRTVEDKTVNRYIISLR